MSGYRGGGYGLHGDDDGRAGFERERGEGDDPRARRAAAEWQERFGREGYEGSYARHEDARAPHHDEGYHRFRQRHLEELDRDYQDWCREREQQFHREFEDFRGRRRANSSGGLETGLMPGAMMTNDPGDSSTLAEDHAADRLVANQDLVSDDDDRARR